MEEEKKEIKSINERELDVIAFWKDKNIFEKSLEKDSPNGEFVFYDGPPTANGRPGIHHLEARAFKDAIPRYKTMRGYHVRRKGGWDTHGLPVELQVEKQLGLTSKKQIEEYGIDKFNIECKKSVWTYIDEWQKFTDRVGYWIDHKEPYITYDSSYIESLWNIVKVVDDRKLLYKDYRIVPWCSRCGTALSSHELAQGYKDVKDLSVTAKFKVVGQENTYLLAWTTTPWTLPGNVALAVNPELQYIKIKVDNDYFILGKDRLVIFETEYEIVEEYTGADLLGLSYLPLYPFFANQIPDDQKDKMDKAYKVYGAPFVTATDGTGIVHTAVMYGQDDFELGTKLGLPKYHLVNIDGTFKSDMDFLSNRFVRDEQVAIDIIKDLAGKGLLFKKEKYEHSYPYCWRCDTALIYYARDSWYIRMSEIKDDLVMNNDFINWEPHHIQSGRFGEWIRDVKDWAISRERYWGTPLPVWTGANGKQYIFTHRDELKKHTKKSGNNYTIIRHGEAVSNVESVVSYATGNVTPLTDKGIEQVKKAAKDLKDKKFDIIYVSPFLRTRQTADLIAEIIGLPKTNIIEDPRLVDLNAGIYEGKKWSDYFSFYKNNQEERFTTPPPGGETMNQVRSRVGDFLYEIESNLKDKNVLIIAHGAILWMLNAVSSGMTPTEAVNFRYNENKGFEQSDWIHNAVPEQLDFVPIPHNENYELDLHRPYIDDYPVYDEEGNKLTRENVVMDCWFDSGCMPFAQDGYPFKTNEILFPADYICEGLDQTRGWFYTLHAVAALMGRGAAYKNVICLGLVMDKDGQKMSKSRGNAVDPWELCDRFGADALRFWMYSVNQPGDFKNFDEKTVDEVVKKVFNLVRNVYAFYDLYRDRNEESLYGPANSHNVLDKWIIIKLNNLIKITTDSMDNYSLFTGTREIRNFVDDLSTWYTRRSRESIRGGVIGAHSTLYFVLKNLAKIMAPFTPFIAEELWQNLRLQNDKISVHLEDWPQYTGVPESEFILESMDKVRSICTVGHALRKTHNIPVRQPLRSFTIKDSVPAEYIAIIADELNVEMIITGEDYEFDTKITEELKNEGNLREFVRYVQDTRKRMGLLASNRINLKIKTNIKGQDFILFWKDTLMSEVGAQDIIFDDAIIGEEFVIDNLTFIISIV